MKTYLTILLLLPVIAFSQQDILGTGDSNLILLRPTGNEIDSLVEMEIISDTSQLSSHVDEIVKTSAISEILALHDLIQVYLLNTIGKPIEPAYLALTQNQGGFAKKGFVLTEDGISIEKRHSYYVDITEDRIDQPAESLMSITQLYPHELGHIMYRLLSENDTIVPDSKNVSMHFFSMITDYQIAFNEGFAEHMENLSRLSEENKKIDDGISEDKTRIAEKSRRAIAGFKRDFLNPWRIGFYKMSMLVWYQQFEDYKRFIYPLNGNTKYLNEQISSFNNQNNLIYRNSGVRYNPQETKNQVQTLACEGSVSAFFTLLSQTEAKNVYKDASFYYPFTSDSTDLVPKNQFSPLQNLFIKYFVVLRKYVTREYTEKAQLIDFIDGYLAEFPEEKSNILDTYKKATGLEYSGNIPSELWFLVKDQPHGILALDAYAGLSVPIYTFEINAAEIEDLMTIRGLKQVDAEAILTHRRNNKLFETYDEIYNLPGISKEASNLIKKAEFDAEYIESLDFPEELNIKSVIMAPIMSLVKYMGIYFVIFMAGYFTLLKRTGDPVKTRIWISVKYLLIWIVFLLSGLIIAASASPWYYLFGTTLLMLLIAMFLKGKNRQRSLVMISLMTVALLISVI